jgi:hypothetical protein
MFLCWETEVLHLHMICDVSDPGTYQKETNVSHFSAPQLLRHGLEKDVVTLET